MGMHQIIGEQLLAEEMDRELDKACAFVAGLRRAEDSMSRMDVPASLVIKVTQAEDDAWDALLGHGRC